jgi:two-component system, NtrC family, response regulator AtoC
MRPLSPAREQGETGPAAVRVLIVEDEALFAAAVRKRLQKSGMECTVAGTLAEARSQLAESTPDLVLLDLRLPDGSGMQFLESVQDVEHIPVIVLTAYAEVDEAVRAMKQGAADYLKKPVDLEELALTIDRVLEAAALRDRLAYSRSRDSHSAEGSPVLGESRFMREVREQIARLAKLTSASTAHPPNVLILGETGSGKDVAARLLHAGAQRRDRPFVHVDCAALPRDLMEAELFGHEKGAFTSASGARVGLIEAAEDGTVFLDEIGELALELQAKLLSVIERRRVRRVGSTREHAVQAQFVAATNRDLQQLVAQGRFRADLYYRLNVLTLSLPPLRSRGGDVLQLADAFTAQTARRYGLGAVRLTEDARDALLAYDWPGNVRELKHLVERAVMLAAGNQITAADLALGPNALRQPTPADGLDGLTLEGAEQLLIQRALERTDGNVSEAARRLGVSRMALRYRMEKYGIRGE